MQFAYPPRKNSNPTAFTPRTSSRVSLLRRGRPRLVAFVVLAILGLLYIFVRPRDRHAIWMASHVAEGHATWSTPTPPTIQSTNYASNGKPKVVLVTVFDETNFHGAYLDMVRENRKLYAEKHGYATFFPKVGNYDLNGSPFSWTKVVAMRHALAQFPDSTFFWFLEQDAFIMNMDASIEGTIMAPATLEANMIKDYPVVPPDSIIKTFAHLRGQDVDFLLTQDYEGLSTASFIIRNGEWAKFFFETWYDPIYRSYNFQKAETHALEHIVQWHPSILSKMALVPQRTINAYSKDERGAKFKKGDMAVRVLNCVRTSSTVCENEAMPFIKQWRTQGKH